MTVYEGSRYNGLPVIRTKAADGRSYPTVYGPVVQIPGLLPYRQHVVQDGDRFDTLAYALWSDPELWWRIAYVNPEIAYPGPLTPGSVIRIPVS